MVSEAGAVSYGQWKPIETAPVEGRFLVYMPGERAKVQAARRNAAYAFELTDDDHARLASVLQSVSGMVMLSSYPCELYDRLYAGWERTERQAHADGANDRIEVLWLNPACSEAQRQQRLAV